MGTLDMQVPWLVAGALCIASSACIFGGEDELDSVYETATLTTASDDGIADGVTPVEITIIGAPDAELTVEVATDEASFIASDSGFPQEKTLFLHDDDGDGLGTATAQVISTTPAVITVALKADRIRTAKEISFQPIRMAIGTPTPSRMVPGQTEYAVCIAVNSAYGRLNASGLNVADPESLTATPSFLPSLVDVKSQPPAGLSCPTAAEDSIGWQGYAGFIWTTPIDFSQTVISYLRPDDDTPLATRTLDLNGDAFGGYNVETAPPVADAIWTSVAVDIKYAENGPFGGQDASGVALQNIRFIPEPGPQFLGSSSGGSSDPPVTDFTGNVVLFFGTDNKSTTPGTYALFATPEHGSSVYLSDITVPDFAP